MKSYRQNLPLSLAIFSMFFGAGNAIFPIILGTTSQSQIGWAFLGLCITAIGGPLLGLLGATLFHGRCIDFFNRAGKIPGALLIMVTLALLGPFAVIPRCVTVSYVAFEQLLPEVPMWLYALATCAICLFCCWKKHFLLPLLGKILSPLLIICLLWLIYNGVVSDSPLGVSAMASGEAFTYGLQTGYDTMDLIAAIYFSAGIWTLLEQLRPKSDKEAVLIALRSGVFACILLGLIYLGLAVTAAKYSSHLEGIAPERLMTVLAYHILGPHVGLVANIAIALACLTTIMSLTMTLAQVISRDLFQWLSYHKAMIAILAITALMSNVGFGIIMQLLDSCLWLAYPAIIILTIVNIASKFRGRVEMPRHLN
ncbi:MAG: branched-chain amino acid transport system II carrier protein [Verrucomicrobia bacterium]|nr:branched-chain amino acid transport system II carrier protein [Verrucomicrobiota bacterium]